MNTGEPNQISRSVVHARLRRLMRWSGVLVDLELVESIDAIQDRLQHLRRNLELIEQNLYELSDSEEDEECALQAEQLMQHLQRQQTEMFRTKRRLELEENRQVEETVQQVDSLLNRFERCIRLLAPYIQIALSVATYMQGKPINT